MKVGGVDHVGIGTGFDGVECEPPERNSYNKFPPSLVPCSKGYSAEDIKKIYCANLLRVMRAVEQRAREPSSIPAIHSEITAK